MCIPSRFSRRGVSTLLLLLMCGFLGQSARVLAQDETATPPAPPPATTTTSDTNGNTLFPNGGVAAPELEENRAASRATRRASRGGRRGGLPGQVGRTNDLLTARAASDPITVRIAYRKAKTVALLRYPELNALEHEAAAASTDVDKRHYLRAYYTQLYSAVKKVDQSSAMASHVDLLSRIAEQRYDPKRRVVGGDEDLVRGGRGGRGRRR